MTNTAADLIWSSDTGFAVQVPTAIQVYAEAFSDFHYGPKVVVYVYCPEEGLRDLPAHHNHDMPYCDLYTRTERNH